MNLTPPSHKSFDFTLRRYHAVGMILLGILLGSVALFSRSSEFFPTHPRRPYRLALTFDDGPHPAYTDRLIRILAEHRVAATFYVVGKQVEKYPHLCRALSENGHEVANHTYSHPNLTRLTMSEVRRELDSTSRLIEQVTQKKSRHFRPPGGRYSPEVCQFLSELGYRMILWTVFPRDHSAPSTDVIYNRIVATAQDGGVVLLHSGIESTLEVLPRVIRDLRARGFHFLTVSEMLAETINPRILSAWYRPSGRDVMYAKDGQRLPLTTKSQPPDQSIRG